MQKREPLHTAVLQGSMGMSAEGRQSVPMLVLYERPIVEHCLFPHNVLCIDYRCHMRHWRRCHHKASSGQPRNNERLGDQLPVGVHGPGDVLGLAHEKSKERHKITQENQHISFFRRRHRRYRGKVALSIRKNFSGLGSLCRHHPSRFPPRHKHCSAVVYAAQVQYQRQTADQCCHEYRDRASAWGALIFSGNRRRTDQYYRPVLFLFPAPEGDRPQFALHYFLLSGRQSHNQPYDAVSTCVYASCPCHHVFRGHLWFLARQ